MTNTFEPAGTSKPMPESTPQTWRDAVTLIRMGVAFFFPWPFMTEDLVRSAERRAQHLRRHVVRSKVRP